MYIHTPKICTREREREGGREGEREGDKGIGKEGSIICVFTCPHFIYSYIIHACSTAIQ